MRSERPIERGESTGPNPIDALIDDAARQMVIGEPSSPLRRAVRERIGRRRPFSGWVFAWGASAAVLVAAVLVGVWGGAPWLPPSGGSLDRDNAQSVQARGTSKGPVVAQSRTTAEADEPERSERSERPERPGRPQRRLAADIVVPPVEEESPIPPITIKALSTAQIAVDGTSGVMPMEIEPLQIEPLLTE